MPDFDKSQPGIMRRFKLRELSGVDYPAQTPALVTIMKRNSEGAALVETFGEITKYLDDPVRAQSFVQVVEDEAKRRAQWKMDEWVWPLIDALRTSITTTLADTSLSDGHKAEANARNIAGFAQAIANKPAAAEITKFLKAGMTGATPTPKENHMAEDVNKTVTDLTAKVEALTKSVETLTAENATLKAKADMAEMDDEEKECAKAMNDADRAAYVAKSKAERQAIAKAAKASDEVIKGADGTEIRKSVVGDGVFAFIKSQKAQTDALAAEVTKQAEINKAAEFTKQAETIYGSMPGTTVEKAAVLAHLSSAPADVQKAAETIFKACDGMVRNGFENLGHSNGQVLKGDAGQQIAKARFDAGVTAIMGRDKIGKQAAMSKAQVEYKADFDAMNGAANAN